MSIDSTYNLNGGFKPTPKRFADLNGPDFYDTPRWATHALLEHETFDGDVWEPACGDGAMAAVLIERGYSVVASDLYDHGYGEAGIDFLTAPRTAANIITNPPYHSAEGFVRAGLEKADRKFALLLRLAFIEGANRQRTLFSVSPPTRVWAFSERVSFFPKGVAKVGSGTTAYAWFVWDKEQLGTTELKWLPPGYRKRFGTDDQDDSLPLFS